MLENIGKNIEIKPGFRQCKYVTGNIEVLLSNILKDTSLDNHHHPQEQFGYCIDGSFSFCYGDNEKEIRKGGYYILTGDIPHSAFANEDFYALDFKYIKPHFMSLEEGENLIKTHDCICNLLNVSEHYVIKLSSTGKNSNFSFISPNHEYILFTEKDATIVISEGTETVETMNLYRVPVNTEIHLKGKNTIYAAVVKKDVI